MFCTSLSQNDSTRDRCTPLDLASLNGHTSLLLTVLQSTDFDIDRSIRLKEILLSFVMEKASEGLEQLCALFLSCKHPLALMLVAYELLCQEAIKKHHIDLHASGRSKEVAGLVAVMATGLIHTLDSYSRVTMAEMFRLDAAYTPSRKLSTMSLATEIPCRTVVASAQLQQLSRELWLTRKLSAQASAWHMESLMPPMTIFWVANGSYFVFLVLLSQLQPIRVNIKNSATSPRAGPVCMLLLGLPAIVWSFALCFRVLAEVSHTHSNS